MALNFRRLLNGLQIVPKTTSTASLAGEIDFDTTSNKLNLNNGTITDQIVTEADTATLTNKTLAVSANPITSTANTAAEFNVSTGNLESSVTTATELGYVHGVTSPIQTQINSISGAAITSLTGDVTATGPGAAVATLATVNSNVGSFGSSTSIPSFTVNGKGLITAASGNVVVAPAGTLSGTTLNSTVVTSSLTAVGTIGTGTWQGTPVAILYGGTGQTTATAAFNALNPMTTTGDLIYESGTNTAARLPIGTSGQILTVSGGVPVWASGSGSSNPIQLTQISTPSTPPSGSNDLYFKATTTTPIITQNIAAANTTISSSANNQWFGQSVTAQVTALLSSVVIPLEWVNNSLTGTMVLVVYADNAGSPGTLIETSSTVNASTISSSLTNITFNFSNTNTLTSGTIYHIIVNTASTVYGGAGVLNAALNTANPYAGGNMELTSNGGSSYSQFASDDITFTINGSINDNGLLYTLNASGSETLVTPQIAYIWDQKTAGTGGGSSNGDSNFHTRDLNTINDPSSIVTSLSGNTFTLPAGTYEIHVTSPQFASNLFKSRLFNVTDSVATLYGSSEFAGVSATSAQSSSIIQGLFTITGSKAFEVDYVCTGSEAGNGLGNATNVGVPEIYTQIKIIKH